MHILNSTILQGFKYGSSLRLLATTTIKGNFYKVLDLTPDADAQDIKTSFYKLSMKYHPDLNSEDEGALQKFREIAEAYEVLSNPESRKQYDLSFRANVKDLKQNRSQPKPGMRGKYRKGFMDDEKPPEMRNIEYDLSEERMQKIWARYKTRWERFEEIEREKRLKEKKIRFRQKIEEKRARMSEMSESEREDFLFKMRLLRTDAADDAVDVKGREHIRKKDSAPFSKDKKQDFMAQENFKENEENIDGHGMRQKFEEAPRFRGDTIFEGLKSENDATDWRNFLKKTVDKNSRRYEEWQENSKDPGINLNSNRRTSNHHGIQNDGNPQWMGALIGGSVIGTLVLGLCLELSEWKDR